MKNFQRICLSLVLLFLGSVFLLSCKQARADGNNPGSHFADKSATEIYQLYCASCHGADLRGGNAQSLVDGVWQFGDGKGYVRRNIQFGVPHLGMPSYEASLSGDQIKLLVDYLYDEQSKAGVVKPDPPAILESIHYTISTEVWVDKLNIPWAITFLNKDSALVTERPGTLRVIVNGKLVDKAVAGTPGVLHEGQGGLMDVNTDPGYAENGWIYLSYSHAIEVPEGEDRAPAMTRIVRGRIRDMHWVDEELVYEAPFETYRTTRYHYGNRIVFDKKGYLYFSIGDRGSQDMAQDPTKPNGKIHRIYPDGSVPKDNPFVESGLPTLYTLGNRNPQGISVHPETDQVWAAEHGPLGGDELNLIKKGVNYGWPVITYGSNYNGTPITEFTRKEGYAQPSIYWKPSIAVCGIEFYQGEAFPKWQNKLLVGALKFEDVRILDIEENRVLHQEVILKNYGRVRDIGLDPDGNVYVVVNQPDRVIRLSFAGERSGQ
ncbi:MAG: PQQ-dependent sugar dehydrogenase [Bacteroides sp.]|nr:PQQ-dependent sugar dehydrogenase [Bacteroides sp.]